LSHGLVLAASDDGLIAVSDGGLVGLDLTREYSARRRSKGMAGTADVMDDSLNLK
jgi:hypothetical protein